MGGEILKTVILLCAALFVLVACSEGTGEPGPEAGSGGEGDAGGETAQARTMPERGVLVPGRYSTGVRFDPPFSLELGKGWRVLPATEPHSLKLGYVTPDTVVAEGKVLSFLHVREVFEPRKKESQVSFEAEPAPEDLVAWFQRHPYLSTEEPEPVEIGGETGRRFDALATVPEGYRDARGGVCPVPCIPLVSPGGDSVTRMTERARTRIAVLEGVAGKAVVVIVSAPVGQFGEFLPRAQETLDTVEWAGS